MMSTVVKLRINQFLRILYELGPLRSVIVMSSIILVLIAVFKSIYESKNLEIILFFIGVALFTLHSGRSDKHFLKILSLNRFKFYLLEYSILAFPFILTYIFSLKWYYSIILIIIVLSLSAFEISFKFKKIFNFFILLIAPTSTAFEWKNSIKIPFIPFMAFEWISGFRKNLLVIVILYLLSVIFCGYIFVIPVSLILLSLIVSSFYLDAEPREMVEIFQLPSKKFLLMKLKNHFELFLGLCIPLVILFLIFNIEFWYVLLFVVIASIIIQIFSLLFKYALYTPNENLKINMLFIWGITFCLIIPFLIPIPIIMIFRYYKKAISNLNFYLNAYN